MITEIQILLIFPVHTGRKLNVHKTFRKRPRRLLNVLCAFNLRPVSAGELRQESLEIIIFLFRLFFPPLLQVNFVVFNMVVY